MKKHIKSLWLLGFVYLPSMVFGIRVVDLKTNLLSPRTDQYIYSPAEVTFEYRVYNQGPDTLFPTDTFFGAVIYYDSSRPRAKNIYQPVGRIIVPGDSIDFKTVRYFNLPQSDPKLIAYVFVNCRGNEPVKGDNRWLSGEFHNTIADNSAYVRLKHIGSKNLGIHTIKDGVQIYPNPSNGLVYFVSKDIEIRQCKLFNKFGVEVEVNQIQNDSGWVLDISSLSSDLYFIKIETNEGIIEKKILKIE
ncbi:MAG: T9SS type A sorting domain-containing protein [Flavobacteriales bacterium]|nr:T9SS type A sorting domain-containing protein [Flavobacteriales bacterium]